MGKGAGVALLPEQSEVAAERCHSPSQRPLLIVRRHELREQRAAARARRGVWS